MKNRKAWKAIAAAAVLTIASMTLPATTVSADEASCDVVVLGDSISTGYGLAEGSLSYVTLLDRSITTSKNVQNFAQDKLTTAGLLEMLQTDTTVQEAVSSADVILVSIGANDVLQPILDNDVISLEDYSSITELAAAVKANMIAFQKYLMNNIPPAVATANENIDSIITQLKSSNSDARIVFQTAYDPASIENDTTGLSQSSISVVNNFSSGLVYQFLEGSLNGNTLVPVGLNQNIRNHSDEIYVADIYAAFHGHAWKYTNISNADIHPNAIGHTLIAETIANTGALDWCMGDVLLPQGDVDNNGIIAVEDAVSVLTEYARISAALDSDMIATQQLAADVNGDGAIGVEDAVGILTYYAKQSAGLQPSFS
jgi:lysophospholipase L1-like esterase